MTSYFEKLTSINSLKFSSTPSDLQSALEKLEQLKNQNSKLELDLKCEHDEKTDLVVLKTSLESEILNLREVNERLEFQVEQLRSEKDNIHGLLARLREEEGNNSYSDKSIKKFASLDDLTLDSSRITPSLSGSHLERIDELDETACSLDPRVSDLQGAASSQILVSRISELESELSRLKSQCRCGNADYDEGLCFSREEDDEAREELHEPSGLHKSMTPGEARLSMLLATQRKIIERLEGIVAGDSSLKTEVDLIKQELVSRMDRIVQKITIDE